MVHGTNESDVLPDLIFHVVLTVVHRNDETGGGRRDIYVLGTLATLEAAKHFAKDSITFLGYSKNEFELYEEQTSTIQEWKHDKGVVVYGKTPAQQEVLVAIATKPNTERLRASHDGTLQIPNGADHLHYVIQTMIDYNTDRKTLTEVEGAYAKRVDALMAAKRCLVDNNKTKEDYSRYDERDVSGMPQDWAFGEDDIIHAISANGENYCVSIKTPPPAYQSHHTHKRQISHHH